MPYVGYHQRVGTVGELVVFDVGCNVGLSAALQRFAYEFAAAARAYRHALYGAAVFAVTN